MGTLSVDKLVKTSAGAAEFTLPATDGTAGQVWQTDGSGQLSVGAYTIPADAVGTSQISALAVDTAEIAANAVDSSEIAADAVTGAKIAYLGDGSGNLSGTIANQQLHFGTAFTLTDDLTINGDVTLAKVRDDGLGQSITGSGRTLTGTGTITMGVYLT